MKLVIALTTLVGCVSDPGASVFEPDAVQTGVYQVDVTTVADSCDPPRFVGTGTVTLFKTSTGISINLLEASGTELMALPAANGYALQDPAAGLRIDPCPPSDSSIVSTYAITGASSDHVDVVSEQTWTIPSSCTTSTSVPSASCGTTQDLHYQLISACLAPCTLVNDPVLTCSCGATP